MGSEHASTTPTTRTWAYCSWHRGYSDTARLVQAADQGSGPTVRSLFACADCRNTYHLVPLADQPL